MIIKSLKTKFAIIALLCACILPSCDDDITTVTKTSTFIGAKSESVDFIIYIHDLDLNPIQGAHVAISGTNYCTTADGIITLQNIALPPEGQIIVVSSPDYITSPWHLHAMDNSDNFVSIPLTKIAEASFPIVDGISSNANVQIMYPDTMLDADGQITSNIATSVVAVKNSSEPNYFPTKLHTDDDGNISYIESIIEITLATYDNSGSPLSLPSDSVLNIVIDGLPAGMDSLPYYLFDETLVTWDHEGYFKSGDSLAGNISFANGHIVVGTPVIAEFLAFKAVDESEFTINNLPFFIRNSETQKYLTSGFTDQSGYGKVMVPSNTPLELVTYINRTLGNRLDVIPSRDTSVELSFDAATVIGSVQMCSTQLDSSALVSYRQGADLLFAFADESNFSVTLLQPGEVIFQAYNPDLLTKSDELTVVNPSDGEDIGPLVLCESLQTNATITITSNITENTLWRNCNTYILDGLIYVEPDATLTIEEGTLIKAKAGQGSLASGLVVSRGGRILAVGTASRPIIFTSEADLIRENQIVSPNLDETHKGLWGGLILLGDAPVSASDEPAVLASLDNANPLNFYGGTTTNDDSGELSYVSIRHAGTELSGGAPVAGLTLAGVGSATDIDHIEIVGSGGDGIGLYGGTVILTDMLVTSATEDSYKIDQSFGGRLSNFIVLLDESSRNGFKIEGGEGLLKEGATVSRGSVKGYRENSVDPGHYFTLQEGARGSISNCYFFSFAEQSHIIIKDVGTANNYLMDSLLITDIAIDTSDLTGGNNTAALILKDESGGSIFGMKPLEIQLVQSPIFGASENAFLRWTHTDVTGKLEGF